MNQLIDRPAAAADRSSHDWSPDEVISDEAMRGVFAWMGVVAATAFVVVIFAAGVRWASADRSPEPYGNADVGFLQDMIDHHQQALVIAGAYLANNSEGDAAPYAREVVYFQRREIERMDSWLADAGIARGNPGRQAMAWMGMPTAVHQMPGMQPAERIAELAAATGPDADRLFFATMSEHHLGGAHMADAAAAGARRSDIRQFAEKMSYNQRIEVVEYDQASDRLGLVTI